jgi:glyoxylase-like metal-dependent hydrolase (beta-lactamase superfamily II)
MSTTQFEAPNANLSPPPVVQGDPVQLADGIFVIPDRRVDLVPNIGIVVGTQAALVIDSGLGPRNGAYVLEQAKRLARDRQLYLTITHFHPEHGFGAEAFKGSATIVYNRAQRDELRRKGAGYIELFKGLIAELGPTLDEVTFVDPDVTYDGQAEIDLGGHRAVLRSVGPAHSAGDQTVFIDDRVLFAGDLLETRMFAIFPYFPPLDTDVNGSRWIGVLDDMIASKPEIVVPGHGEVSDTTLIHAAREYLRYVRGEATRLRGAGASVDEAIATIDDAARRRWTTWDHPEWIAFAARVFYMAAS